MSHPKLNEVFPIGTVVRLLNTGEFAKITDQTFLDPYKREFFLHYLGEIESRQGKWCIMHGEVEVEVIGNDN